VDLFNDSRSNIPNKIWDWDSFTWVYHRGEIEDELDGAKILIEESKTWFDREMYYTSTTKSFLSLISSRYVHYACDYFNIAEEDRPDYVKNLIDEINVFCEGKNNEARNSKITGFVSLQCVGGAQKRASEASDYLTNANSSYKSGDYLSSLNYLAKAKERSESIGWWLNITSFFNESGNISTSDIDSLAIDYIEEAQQAITYSSVLLDEMNAGSNYLSDAQSMLDTARDERENGYPAAALFEALDAITKANLEIETIGVSSEDDYKEKINRINNSASSNILKSVGYGIKPVLPVCYYEYADSLLDEDDLTTALFYYRFSGMIAGALSFTNVSKGTVSSRYEGVLEPNPPKHTTNIFSQFGVIVVIFALGGIGGLGLGLLIAALLNDTSSKSNVKSKKEKNILEKSSYKSYKGYSYPNNEVPRSIKDYYRKNK
jgi:predicted S18 family serine protease